MDENSVSFQMFSILLYFIILGSESQISVFKQCQNNTLDDWVSFDGGACAFFFSLKKNFTRHFARFNFSRLSLDLIFKYYPILHEVKR